MTVVTEGAKRKLSLLQLAEELGNVSKIMGDPKAPSTRRSAPFRRAVWAP